MKKIYFFNNDAGANALGLRDSVYFVKEELIKRGLISEEANVLEQNDLLKVEEDHPSGKFYTLVKDNCLRCKSFAQDILDNGDIPVLVAGDHSIGAGSAGASAAKFQDLGVVWIDAHADINTGQTSPSGNIHGMPIAALLGLGLSDLSAISGIHYPVQPENIAYLGLRDLDPGEEKFLAELPIHAYSYQEIQTRGLDEVLQEIKHNLKAQNLHISLDLDSLNPIIAPGVSVPAIDGFEANDVRVILNFFMKKFTCRSFDVVEYNAQNDQNQMTLKLCLDFIQQILGS